MDLGALGGSWMQTRSSGGEGKEESGGGGVELGGGEEREPWWVVEEDHSCWRGGAKLCSNCELPSAPVPET